MSSIPTPEVYYVYHRWAEQFNSALQREFQLVQALPAVFIDTFHNHDSEPERRLFLRYTDRLWDIAQDKLEEPFHCRDIQVLEAVVSLVYSGCRP